MDLPLLLSAFSSLVAAFIASAIWATRPTGASRGSLSFDKGGRQGGKLPSRRAATG
jgi:hypothetical protein